MEIIAKLLIFLPLLSSIHNGIYCKRISNRKAGIISSVAIIISAICATILFYHVGIGRENLHIILTKWISFGTFNANWSIYVDQLTAIMFIVVSYVSAVVHIYSLGYMADDNNLPKFLSYLSLFTFCMFALVSADNFLQLFFGWEGVGVCSYLLIGYYFQKDSAGKAAIKAFVVNRVGDFALIIGIVLIYLNNDTIEFAPVFANAQNLANQAIMIFGNEYPLLDVICLLLFIGCMGKSAQIGLHVWLPDAMEGPTPVSALIHAATMVTAGVFLVARCSFMYEYSPISLQIITVIGAVTCLFAATVAIAQSDIKRIIAYSTCSQLGYMFFACGVSAYHAGIFHLVTHGFFKALLFLGAGSVIHAAHEQDIFKMGGLRRAMPITYMNFWIGSLAIIGVFPFAGFYSKDMVLEAAYEAGGVGEFAFAFGIIAAILTAIYSMKIIMLTFHGKTRMSDADFAHAHESPRIMNVPLIVLSAGTLFSGMFGYYILNIGNPGSYFAGSIYNLHVHGGGHHAEMIIQLMPLIVGLTGAFLGFYFYKGKKYIDVAKQMKFIFLLLQNKYYFDELYNKIFVKTTRDLSQLSRTIDIRIIDRFGPNGASNITKGFSWFICQLQTGYIYNYALYIILSLVVCVSVFIVKYHLVMGS